MQLYIGEIISWEYGAGIYLISVFVIIWSLLTKSI